MIDAKKILSLHKFLFIGCIAFVAVYPGVDKLLSAPLKSKLTLTKTEIQKLNSDKANLAKEVESLKKKGADLKNKEGQLTDYFLLKSKLVDFRTASDFFKKLVSYNGIKVELLKPGKKEAVSQFVRWHINISAKGSYENIYGYLDYLESLPYVLNVKKLELAKTEVRGMNRINLSIEAVGR